MQCKQWKCGETISNLVCTGSYQSIDNVGSSWILVPLKLDHHKVKRPHAPHTIIQIRRGKPLYVLSCSNYNQHPAIQMLHNILNYPYATTANTKPKLNHLNVSCHLREISSMVINRHKLFKISVKEGSHAAYFFLKHSRTEILIWAPS